METAIEARQVSKLFGSGDSQVTALDNVSVSIRENEFFTLLGPSGCGKTTLLQADRRLRLPEQWRDPALRGGHRAASAVQASGQHRVPELRAVSAHDAWRRTSASALRCWAVRAPRSTRASTAMLKLVRMEQLKNRRTSEISGGQQQRVALARALAPQPKVLLLDEPLSALDYKLRKEMQIELKRLQHETGITFIFVTHDQEEALTMSDRIAVMSSGKILQVGSPWDIYDRPAERFVADFIGETNFLKTKVVSVADGRAMVRLSSGADIAATFPAGVIPQGEVTIVVRPEHAQVAAAPSAASALQGVIENIVYLGTDTHFHVRLEDGGRLHRSPAEQQERTMRLLEGRAGRHRDQQRRRPDPEGLIAMASAQETARAAEARRHQRARWLLSAPALLIILLAATGPLLIVLVYSFLTPGPYGDVKWQFSTDAWVSVVLERDIFDDTLSLADAHLIDLLALGEAGFGNHAADAVFGFPTAYFIATRPERTREVWLFLITIPFWTNLLIRTFAMLEIIRNEGIINSLLLNARADRTADPDAVHRFRHHGRHGLCLPAADGAAALRQHGEARFPPGRGGLRSLCHAVQGSAPDHLSAGQARRHRRLHPRLHSLARRLCHPERARRRQEHDARQPDRAAVRTGAQLAAWRGPVDHADGDRHGWRCSSMSATPAREVRHG